MDNQRDNSEAGSARSSTSYDPTPVSFVMPSPIGLLGTNKKDDEASNWSQFAIAAANAGVGSSARATAR